MTRAVVCGIAGRMGDRLGNLILDADDLHLAGATERPGHEAVGRDAGAVLGRGSLGVAVTDVVPATDADVVIAFTTPESTLADAAVCAAAGTETASRLGAFAMWKTLYEPLWGWPNAPRR